MNFVVIYNPNASRIDTQFLEKIKSALTSGGHTVTLEKTEYKGHSIEIAKKYRDTDNIVIACGGDGTIHEVANGLALSSTPMLALPMGTGNDFCKKLYGKGVNYKQVAENLGLLNGKPSFKIRPTDLISVNDFWCINVMSIGFDTLVETVGKKINDKLHFLGSFCYKLGILICLFKDKHFTMNIAADSKSKKSADSDKISADDFILFAICNASYYGGGFYPAPDAKLNDGILDAVVADSMNAFNIMKLAPSYTNGKVQEKSDKVHCYSLTKGKISSKDGSELKFNCDGENYFVSEIDFKVVSGALNLCTPTQCESAYISDTESELIT